MVKNTERSYVFMGFPVERIRVRGATHVQWRCRRSTERGVCVDGGGQAASAAAAATGARPVVATEHRPSLNGHAPLLSPRRRRAGYGAAVYDDGCRRSGNRSGGEAPRVPRRRRCFVNTPASPRPRHARVYTSTTRCFRTIRGGVHANLPRRHSITRCSVNNTASFVRRPRFAHNGVCYDR